MPGECATISSRKTCYRMSSRTLILALALVVILPAMWGQASQIEKFFSNPAVDKCKLSPDAKSLAMLSSHEGFMNIHILDISSGTFTAVTQEKFDVVDFFWSGSEYLVYSNSDLERERKLGRMPVQLFSIQRNGEGRRPLAFRLSRESNSVIFPKLLHQLPDSPKNIIVSFSSSGNQAPDVYNMNITNGKPELILKNPGDIHEFITDENGIPRFGRSYAPDGSYTSFYSSAESDEWTPFMSRNAQTDQVKIVALASTADIGVAVSNLDQDKLELYRVQLRDSLISSNSTLSHHSCDIDAKPIYSYGSGGFIGVSYEELKPRQAFFDSNFKNLHDAIDARIPNSFNRVNSHNENGAVMILESISAQRPIQYHRVTLNEGLSVKQVGQSYPLLADYPMRGSNPHFFRASDGQLVYLYLTLPESYEKGNTVPVVVLPHDGPWSRVTWGFRDWTDYIPEYFASKGFAVLQVNSRGSTGFGKKHLATSFKNLDRIYLDLIEAIQWAVDQGYADQKRVGAFGIGWGGSMALSVMTERPDMFQFGIALEGIFDLEKHVQGMTAGANPRELQRWKNRIGNPDIPEERINLRKWSPIHRLDRLKAPVFIYTGARGDRVHPGQSVAFVGELNRLGLPNKFARNTDPKLPSFSQEARINLFTQVDSFLNDITRTW